MSTSSSSGQDAVCEVPGQAGQERLTVWLKRPFMRRLARLFEIDVRSLAIFRIGLAVLIIMDLLARARFLQAHYTDFGVLPRSVLLERFSNPTFWSIHLLTGTLVGQAIIFGIAGLFALALLVGFHARLAAVVSWILLVSVQARNPALLQGGDVLFRMLAFWAMFVPLGARYSLDSALNSSAARVPKSVLSFGTVGLLVQVAFVFIFAVIIKSKISWVIEASAIYYALSVDQFTRPAGYVLLKYPVLMQWLSRGVFFLQLIGSILLFVPFWMGPIRSIVVLAFLVWQLSMSQFMALGLFPLIVSVAMLPLLPTWFWDRLAAWAETPARALKIYFDVDCGFCRKMVYVIREGLLLPWATIQPAQEEAEVTDAMRRNNSWVVVDHAGQHHFEYQAFLVLIKASPVWWWLYPVLKFRLVAAVGTRIYRYVSGHRPLLSRMIAWLAWRPLSLKLPVVFQVLAALVLVATLWWNIAGVVEQVPKPAVLRQFVWVLRLEQEWNMFARPWLDDGWYVIPGKLRNGREVNVFQNTWYVDWGKPKYVAATYPTQRWRKYLMNMSRSKEHRLYYGRYLCRSWNARQAGEEELVSFDIYFVRENTLPNGKVIGPWPDLLWQHRCIKG